MVSSSEKSRLSRAQVYYECVSMPDDYITRDEFHTTLNLRFLEFSKEIRHFMLEQQEHFKEFVIEQRKEFERYTGSLAEHFQDRLGVISEGLQINMEKTERLEGHINKEIDGIDRRLSRIELTRARKRKKK